MTVADFRKIALSMPEAIESEHMAHPDFRVGGKIFATLGYPDQEHGMVNLPPGEQAKFCNRIPKFSCRRKERGENREARRSGSKRLIKRRLNASSRSRGGTKRRRACSSDAGSSFPNSVWERTCLRNSVVASASGNRVAKTSGASQTEFGNEGRITSSKKLENGCGCARTLILTFSLREKELSLPLGETDAKRQ